MAAASSFGSGRSAVHSVVSTTTCSVTCAASRTINILSQSFNQLNQHFVTFITIITCNQYFNQLNQHFVTFITIITYNQYFNQLYQHFDTFATTRSRDQYFNQQNPLPLQHSAHLHNLSTNLVNLVNHSMFIETYLTVDAPKATVHS